MKIEDSITTIAAIEAVSRIEGEEVVVVVEAVAIIITKADDTMALGEAELAIIEEEEAEGPEVATSPLMMSAREAVGITCKGANPITTTMCLTVMGTMLRFQLLAALVLVACHMVNECVKMHSFGVDKVMEVNASETYASGEGF